MPNQTGIYETSNNNLIGGTSTSLGNLISGNDSDGIKIWGTGNQVLGNKIGTNASGNGSLGNGGNGIGIAGNNSIIGGALAGAANLISGNDGDGIAIGPGTGNQILGNKIGTNTTGSSDLGNGEDGVNISDDNNTIGGATTGAGNLISGNDGDGIEIRGTGNQILGNKIGANLNGNAALGNGGSGILIGSSSSMPSRNTIIGGAATGAGNLISGNGGDGILIEKQHASGARVEGNKIGADATGAYAIPNAWSGVRIFDAPDNTLGGSSAAAGNLISGNGLHGVLISGKHAANNLVLGNKIGANAAGSLAIPNLGNGVAILFAPRNQVGGELAGEGNLIAGNGKNGVYLSTSFTAVMGNQIGVKSGGTQALPNAKNGIEVYSGSHNTLGGQIAGAGNLISGNSGAGIAILEQAAEYNQIFGNRIGVNAGGSSALGNGNNGIIVREAFGTTIGGSNALAANLISGNDGYGIVLAGDHSISYIQGNQIGSDANGASAIGNTYGGVLAQDGSINFIGGSIPAEGNLISGNGGPGVAILSQSSNVIQNNKIGSDSSGWNALGNLGEGIGVWSGYHSILDNRIVSNQGAGVLISGAEAESNSLYNNQIGLAEDEALKVEIPNGGGGFKLMGNSLEGVLITGGAADNQIGAVNQGNSIAGNGRAGVAVVGNGMGNRVIYNNIFSNTTLGIDLGSDGVTLNDDGDADAGPNGLQNFPILTGAAPANGGVAITGYMPAAPATQYTLQFFANSQCDPAKYGEGSSYLGEISLASNAAGMLYLDHTLPFTIPTGYFLTATATEPHGSTSEFSPCFPEPVVWYLFMPTIRK